MTGIALRRSIGLPLLTLYGLGTILGAGIYVLIGEVARTAGRAAPSAFVLAAILAAVTAFSFAELSSRLPKSAAEAAYAEAGFGSRRLAQGVGWAVALVAIVSAATMIRGFIGYLDVFVQLPHPLVSILLVVVLALVAFWGIGESLVAAAAVTLIEIGGLLFVCIVAGDSLGRLPAEWPSLLPGTDVAGASNLVSGAFLAFYAFIGFEDMVNVAEEVRDPTRTLPRAIVLSLAISTLIYFAVATIATLAVPGELLAGNEAPLAAIVESRGLPPETIAGISLVAVLNGALIQIILASRMLYGLASEGLAWRRLAYVHPRTQTPAVGTVAVAALILLLTLFFSLSGLARATSFLALAIFAIVNLALWRLKGKPAPAPDFAVPRPLPLVGFVLCLGMIASEGLRSL